MPMPEAPANPWMLWNSVRMRARLGRTRRPKRRHELPGEALHRAHDARVLKVAETEAAVEVRDAHDLLDPLDLTDHRVRGPENPRA